MVRRTVQDGAWQKDVHVRTRPDRTRDARHGDVWSTWMCRTGRTGQGSSTGETWVPASQRASAVTESGQCEKGATVGPAKPKHVAAAAVLRLSPEASHS